MSKMTLVHQLDDSMASVSIFDPTVNDNSSHIDRLDDSVSREHPRAAPALVQGSFPAASGLTEAGIIPGENISAALDPVGVPSECLLLKNMFDPSTETEPDFDLDIKEDVIDECSNFGQLNHIYVNRNSFGFVYLRLENTQAAMGAQCALHGRWFGGKMITASYMTPETYDANSPSN